MRLMKYVKFVIFWSNVDRGTYTNRKDKQKEKKKIVSRDDSNLAQIISLQPRGVLRFNP